MDTQKLTRTARMSTAAAIGRQSCGGTPPLDSVLEIA